MYNPVLHKDRAIAPVPVSHTKSLPRPGHQALASVSGPANWTKSLTRAKHRSRSRSPGGLVSRSQLSLVICPDFHEYPEGMREYPPSPGPGSPRLGSRTASPMGRGPKNQFPMFSGHLGGQAPVPHALARTRGTEVLRDSASLPCSPVFARLGAGARFSPVSRELSLPSSPNLPRIHVQDFEPSKVSGDDTMQWSLCQEMFEEINIGPQTANVSSLASQDVGSRDEARSRFALLLTNGDQKYSLALQQCAVSLVINRGKINSWSYPTWKMVRLNQIINNFWLKTRFGIKDRKMSAFGDRDLKLNFINCRI